MSNQFTKGTALITGSSSGIGAIYADRFARRGYDLILVARDKSRLESLAAQLAKETGRKIDILPADLNAKADLLKVEERLKIGRDDHGAHQQCRGRRHQAAGRSRMSISSMR